MELREILGFVLVIAGIVSIYIAQLSSLKKAKTKAEGPAVLGLPELIEEVIKRLPKQFLPGALMILVGAFLMLGGGDEADTATLPQPAIEKVATR